VNSLSYNHNAFTGNHVAPTFDHNTFTFSGDHRAEMVVANMLRRISETISNVIKPEDLTALVLLGGYGKGEGGIVHSNGQPHPHNNFDFLLVLKNCSPDKIAKIKSTVMQHIQKSSKQLNIGIDLSVISQKKITRMPTRVMWYDMKEGHKTLLGDKQFIPSLPHTVDNIPSWDMRNLMVNRGSLLLINRICLQSPALGCDTKKLIIKHTMKAIIGYGDALLFSLNEYHWSYKEKLRRLVASEQVDTNFKTLYKSAMTFRFEPNYALYQETDLIAWQSQVIRQLKKIHLECEAKRLGVINLTWHQYLEAALSKLFTEDANSYREWIKKCLNLIKPHPGSLPSHYKWMSTLGVLIANETNILPILYPFILFDIDDSSYQHFASSFLCVDRTDSQALNSAYLKKWGNQFDEHFWSVLKKHNITL